MIWYVRGPRGSIRHLRIWANDADSATVTGRPVPICGLDRGRRWRSIQAEDAAHLPLCSRCLSELDNLNEAASNG